MQIKSRITQRYDTLSNWTRDNIVLLNGELAIVDCGDQTKFKVGNGISAFTQLPFIDEHVLSTIWVTAHAISQGTQAHSAPFGLASGWRLSANANYSQALGFKSQTSASHNFSFAWNGDDQSYSILGEDYYTSHGKGTFNINPISGLQGVFIGENSLCAILSDYANVSVDNEAVKDFKMLHTSYDEYAQLVIAEKVDPHTMYVLSADGYDDQHGNRIANVGAPISADDAATKTYVDDAIYAIADDYYLKSETSNDIEIAEALDKKASVVEVSQLSDALSTAISTDIKNLADNYAKKTDIKVEYVRNDKKIYLSAGDYVTSVDADDFIKDGMISTVTYDETTHMLCIVWNTDAGSKTTTINLSGLIDTYAAGYGLSLANGEFSVDAEEIAQKSDLDNYYLTSETSSAIEISQAISDFVKVSVDNMPIKDFKMLHISYDEYIQLVNDENIDPHTIYVLSADGYDDQIGNRIINLGSPISADDAATKNYVDSEIAKIPQPDLSQFYKKSETSSSAEIANAIKNNVQVSAALDSGTQIASISVDGVATPIYAPVSEGIYRYPLITAELSTINGQLCCLIQDHAITTIEVSSAETPLVVKLPPKPVDNGARDFILRIEVSSSTAPGVTFTGLDESITFDSDSEDWMTIEPGLNLISFTETK